MSNIKRLTGREVIAILERFGFEVQRHAGAHVKLRRLDGGGVNDEITLPFRDELDRATLRAIFHQVKRFVPEPELRRYFYP